MKLLNIISFMFILMIILSYVNYYHTIGDNKIINHEPNLGRAECDDHNLCRDFKG
jgi:hypothetical protein